MIHDSMPVLLPNTSAVNVIMEDDGKNNQSNPIDQSSHAIRSKMLCLA